MKTIKEHLEELPEPIRSLALKNVDTQARFIGDLPSPDLNYALMSGFNWSNSPEGSRFWVEVFVKIRKGKLTNN